MEGALMGHLVLVAPRLFVLQPIVLWACVHLTYVT